MQPVRKVLKMDISKCRTYVPAPTVAEAVFARCLSAIKEERIMPLPFYQEQTKMPQKKIHLS